MNRALRVALRVIAICALLVLAAVFSGWRMVQSDWFKTRVRQAIVEEVERATGGKAEVGSYAFDWRAMRAEVRGLVVHGLEPAGAAPLFKADRVVVGMKLISALRRKVDIRSLELDRPAANIIVDAHGKTNIPEPRAPSGKRPLDQLIDMAVGEYRVSKGEFQVNDKRVPLEAAGRDLDLKLSYKRASRAYAGELTANAVQISAPVRTPVSVDTSLKWRVDPSRLQIEQGSVGFSDTKATLQATVTGLDGTPRIDGTVDARMPVADANRLIKLPIEAAGEAHVTGKFAMDAGKRWTASGTATAKGLAWKGGNVAVRDVSGESHWATDFHNVKLEKLVVHALGGDFHGHANVTDWRAVHAQGKVNGFALSRLIAVSKMKETGYSATVSGDLELDLPAVRLAADLQLTPQEGPRPLSGIVNVRYEQSSGALEFGNSALEWGNSHVRFAGRLADHIKLGVMSGNLDDFVPALELASAKVDQWPAKLDRGVAQFEGTVTGVLGEPVVAGHLEAGPLIVREQRIEKVSGDVELARNRVRLTRTAAVWNGTRIAGDVQAALSDWKLTDASAINGRIGVSKAGLSTLLKQVRSDVPAEGTVTATVTLDGTYAAPKVAAKVSVDKPVAGDETFDRAEADIRYSPLRIEIINGVLTEGPAVAHFSGTIERDTDLIFEVTARNWRLRQWRVVEQQQAKLDGGLALKMTGSARRAGNQLQLTGLNGQASIEAMTVENRPVGNVEIFADTRGRIMAVRMDTKLRNSLIQASAEWNLGGNSFGLGQVRIPKLTFADLQELGFLGDPTKELAFRGEVEGEMGFSGPVLQPEKWTGLAKITRLEVEPVRGLPGTQRVDPSRLLLRNRDPLIAQVDANGVTMQAVHLIAQGTDLEVTGAVGFKTRNPWNLRVKGTLNLPTLSTFEPDLVATGVSIIDASVRGSYERPQLQGRMEVRNASFRLRDVPNGLSRANGVIVFDRTRANIESFTAQTGGGDLKVTGFVGLAGPELLYRLQATAQKVRVRYPEAVSTTFDGTVNLTGTATQSLLSGTVSVTRVALNPQTDIGGLLQTSGRARQTTIQSGFLRGMQLDLRVETAPDAELQTSLTRDLQPQAELRVRGSFSKPVLLGHVSVEQGEINFFGNRYTITRGEVSFFNTAKVEPVLDLDLETRVRGITVTINFTGPIDKLAVSYRSDPPLQSTEIVALLTVGRTPGSSVTPNMPTRNQSVLQSGGNSLLGQAISQPITGRLERLFGVSRIKIDPDLTSVTNTAQARLTVEQQLSRDITITYITNLNRTQQQIVRLQWDFSKDFSILAVRDENGIFGVDFLWRRRF